MSMLSSNSNKKKKKTKKSTELKVGKRPKSGTMEVNGGDDVDGLL